MNEHFDTILESLVNGQNKQAVEQMTEMGLGKMPELMDYFAYDLEQPEMAVKAAKVFFIITFY